MITKFFFIRKVVDAIFQNGRMAARFKINLLLAFLVVLFLYILPFLRVGDDILNKTHDHFVKEYLKDVSPQATFNNLHIVTFSEEVHKEYYGHYYTPRGLLGKSIYNAIEKGAPVVITDYSLDSPIPTFCVDERSAEDENKLLLHWLKKAAEKALQNGAVILIPELDLTTTSSTPLSAKHYFTELMSILQTNSTTIRQGGVRISHHRDDYRTRHFSFFVRKKNEKPHILTLPVMAAIYEKYLLAGQPKRSIQEKEQAVITANAVIDTHLKMVQSLYSRHKTFTVEGSTGEELFLISTRSNSLPARLLFRFTEAPIKNSSTPNQLEALPLGALTKKVVFIGSTWEEMGDFHHTSLDSDVSGVVILANAFDMLSNNHQLRNKSFIIELLFQVLIVSTVALLLYLIFALVEGKMLAFALAGLIFIVVPWFIPPRVENFNYYYYFNLSGIVILIYELLVDLEELFNRKYISE